MDRAEMHELGDLYFACFSDRPEERIALSEARFDTKSANLRADIAARMRDQMKWMFVFWIGTPAPLAGLMVALGKSWL